MALVSFRRVLGPVILLVVVLSPPCRAADLFAILALPPLPLALTGSDVPPRRNSLILSSTWEELYRKWENGREVARFAGNRQDARLDLKLKGRFSLAGGMRLAGRQDWTNQENGKVNFFDFSDQEEASSSFSAGRAPTME